MKAPTRKPVDTMPVMGQVGVFLSLTHNSYHTWADSRLFCPEKWFAEAHVLNESAWACRQSARLPPNWNRLGKWSNTFVREAYSLKATGLSGHNLHGQRAVEFSVIRIISRKKEGTPNNFKYFLDLQK